MADNVVILEPGDERAQKISKAMASQTASDILQLLAENKKSLTEITERLSIPLTTAKYHIENLLEAGLITVTETKYSVKGREIKIYAVTNQLLIVAPRQSNVRSLLLKYTSLFCIVVLGTLAVSILSPLFLQGIMTSDNINEAQRFAAEQCSVPAANGVAETFFVNVTRTPELIAGGAKSISDTAGTTNLTSTPVPVATLVPTQATNPIPIPPTTGSSLAIVTPDIALAFFLGGMIVIFVLLLYEVYLWKKMKNY
ncbi:MAG: helix-turn-helix domain-containing protein [Methanoregula sp.]|jgi:DNA-binding transcriptional ArsR family regulator|nr:helix-turn-helix domain-containing protein [Methanoregula sp.]